MAGSFVEHAHDVAFKRDVATFMQGGGGFCDFSGIKVLVLVGGYSGVEVCDQRRNRKVVAAAVRRPEQVSNGAMRKV